MTSVESNTINSSASANSSAEFWKNHIAQWQSSGLMQATYCRQYQLSYHQFKYWKYKLVVSSPITPAEINVGFTRVQLAETTKRPASSSLCIQFSDGTKVIGIALDTMPLVRQLVEVLR